MPFFICRTCGCQYADTQVPDEHCFICEDDRQYVGYQGQQWLTMNDLIAGGSTNDIRAVEPGVTSIKTVPNFAISQRAFLIQTPNGNLLWDCITLLDEATIRALKDLGGVQAIALSHPHYYSAIVDWSEAFGNVPIYIHKADKQWVTRPSDNYVFWSGETVCPFPGIELICLGGHFPGGAVAHWPAGADGQGILFSGDILQVVQDRRWVSFMYSFPNIIPLAAVDVERIAKRISRFKFENVYGAFADKQVIGDAAAKVQASAQRYIEHLTVSQPDGAMM